MGKRGPKRKDLVLAEVSRLAALGLNQEEIAYSLGVAPSTFYKKKSETLELTEALKRGRAALVAKTAENLIRNSEANTPSAPHGNVTAQIFILKVHGKWKDHHDEEIPEGGEIQEVRFRRIVAGKNNRPLLSSEPG